MAPVVSSLLQEGAPELEVSQFIIGHGLDNLAQKGSRLLQLALQEQSIAKLVHRVRIDSVLMSSSARNSRTADSNSFSHLDATLTLTIETRCPHVVECRSYKLPTMTTLQRVLALCIACFALSVSMPLAAQQRTSDSPASNQEAAAQTEVLDSQQFLLNHVAPQGPAKDYSAAVEKLLSQMTLKEKVGQRTQLDILIISAGGDEELKINPE